MTKKTKNQKTNNNKPGWKFSQHGLGKLGLPDFSRHPRHKVHGTPKMVPAHKPPPSASSGPGHPAQMPVIISAFFLSSRPSWKKWKAGFLLFSRGRRERNKIPQANGQPEDTESSGKGSLAGLCDPLSRWIVYF